MKYLTREQLTGRKEKAVRFVRDVLGDPERAEEIEAESLDDYAHRRRIELLNPQTHSRGVTMAEKRPSLREQLDEAQGALQEIYSKADEALDAELTREEVVAAVKEISDLAEPFAEEEEDQDESGESEDEE